MTAGAIQASTGTRTINDLGGLAKRMPQLAVIMMVGFMASLGLPGLTGFIAEFLILTFSYITLPGFVLFAILAIVITAGYHLWAMQRVMFGVYNDKLDDKPGNVRDISPLQVFSMGAIALLVLYFGLNPNPVLNMMITNSEVIAGLAAALGV
jgi:NADH-quinone oxidoreductase subunit M